nr:MAG TPA: hypothetical protein [Caudoviricetes sp.]
MSVTMHRYKSKEEVQTDKDKLLEELGMSEEDANDLYTMNLLDYSDQCRVEKIRGLNFLLNHGS